MRKLKDIRSIDDLKEFILLNKETIKKAALPVTVAAVLLFFWAFGGEKKEEIKESQSPAETKTESFLTWPAIGPTAPSPLSWAIFSFIRRIPGSRTCAA